MANNSSSSSSGIGFTGLFTIVFITLKLIGKIDWSWWWVLSPLWIVFALVVLGFGIYVLCKILFKPKRPHYRVPAKSKLQERIEDMQEQQRKIIEMRNAK